jgi:subfamily B ATP-binding cassette protein MsbA
VVGGIGALVIIVGGRSIMSGAMTLGDLMMYVLFVGMVAAPLIQIASIGTQISEAFAGLDRIREIMGYRTEDDEDRDKKPMPSLQGLVQFKDVWFEYNEGVPVLKGISFDAPKGTTTALVGSSGSGKSTMLSLVTAFNRPTAGKIFVDGADLAGFKLRDYRSQLGIVLQDNFLFDGTITENIRFSRPDATLAEVKRVAQIAHCTEFIEQFPDQWDTVVGERGVKLSGGQRQRVAIARAILAIRRCCCWMKATVESRLRERGDDPGRVARVCAGADDVRHRPPALDDHERGPDPGSRGWRDRGARDAPGAPAARWAVQAALRQAVQAGAGPVRQSG